MTAINDRLKRGLQAARQGNIDTARTILGEVTSADKGWEPIGGLSPETESKYYRLLGDLLEQDDDEELAQDAWARAQELEEEAIATGGCVDAAADLFDDEELPPGGDGAGAFAFKEGFSFEDDDDLDLVAGEHALVPCGCGDLQGVDHDDHRWDERALHYDDGLVRFESERLRDAQRHVLLDGDTRVEVIEAVETFKSTFEVPEGAEIPDALRAIVDEDASTGWVEKRVEAYTVTRTTYRYDDADLPPARLRLDAPHSK